MKEFLCLAIVLLFKALYSAPAYGTFLSEHTQQAEQEIQGLYRMIMTIEKDESENPNQKEHQKTQGIKNGQHKLRKISMIMAGKWKIHISQEKAQQLASKNSIGESVYHNKYGNHPVVAQGGIHFKSSSEYCSLNPLRERATYYFQRLLVGQGIPPSTFLILKNTKTHQNHSQSRFQEEQENDDMIQASLTIEGQMFEDFLNDWISRGSPQNEWETFDRSSTSALILTSFLTCSSDGKGDNFIVKDQKGKKILVSIDNDLNFYAPLSYKKFPESSHLEPRMRNILYFLPFMKECADVRIQEMIVNTKPNTFILEWLGSFWEENQIYHHLLTTGVISERTYNNQKLSLNLPLSTVLDILRNLKTLKFWLWRNPPLMNIFYTLHPLIAPYYQKLSQNTCGPQQALERLYDYPPSLEEYLNPEETLKDGRTIEQGLSEEKERRAKIKEESFLSIEEIAHHLFADKFYLLYEVMPHSYNPGFRKSFKLLLYVLYGNQLSIDKFTDYIFSLRPETLDDIIQQKCLASIINAHLISSCMSPSFDEKKIRRMQHFHEIFKQFSQTKDPELLMQMNLNPLVRTFIERMLTSTDKLELSCNFSNLSIKTRDLIALHSMFSLSETSHRLESLNLGGNHLTDVSLHWVKRILEHQTNLKEVNLYDNDLHYNYTNYAVELVDVFSSLKFLQTLNLAGTYLRGEGLTHFLSMLKAHPSLTSLHLADNGFSDDEALSLSLAIKGHSTLKTLDLRWNRISDRGGRVLHDALSKEDLSKTPFSCLFLEHNLLDKQIVESINTRLAKIIVKRFQKTRNFQELKGLSKVDVPLRAYSEIQSILQGYQNGIDLRFLEITPVVLSALRQTIKIAPSLKSIELYCNKLGDEKTESLAKTLRYCTNLKRLGLYQNKITDIGLSFLSHLFKNFVSLRDLNLGYNKISDKGIQSLAHALEHNTNLKEVNLFKNPVSDLGIDYFEKILQDRKFKVIRREYKSFSLQKLI
ncbi:MAG: hypothetical protein JNK42_06245 [Caedimonas sp.]|nr:hypothetical protein [Caedimonas sp.]